MVKRLFDIINRQFGGLHQAALLLSLSALASQLLGLLRDRLLAGTFGATQELDIYYASFLIPDFIFVSVGSFLAVTVLIPILIEKRDSNNKEEARDFLGSMLTFFLVSMATISLTAFLLMPWLIALLTPGFSPEKQALTVSFTRVLLLSPFFLGLSNLFGSVTQSYRRFMLYAISPLLYNLGIVSGVVVLYPIFGLRGLVYGVVLGAFAHFALQVPVVVREGLVPRLTARLRWNELHYVVTRSLPRTLSLGANQLADIVLSSLASSMAYGSIAIYNLAFNLQAVPMALIGVSYAVAAFPAMAELYTKKKMAEFSDYMNETLRHILFWAFPVAVFFVVLRAHIVRIILGSGHFSWNDTRLTAASLALYALAVVGQSVIQLFDRTYYAAGKTSRPVLVKLIASGLVMALAALFSRYYSFFAPYLQWLYLILKVKDVAGLPVLTLPIALTVGVIFNLATLAALLPRDLGLRYSPEVRRTAVHAFAGACILGFTCYLTLQISAALVDQRTLIGIVAQAFLGAGVGTSSAVAYLQYVENQELVDFKKALVKRFGKFLPLQPGPEDLG